MSGHALIVHLAGLQNNSTLNDWPPPNYVNPYERTWLPPIVIVLWIIATVFFALRITLRIRGIAGLFGIDDAIIILAWAVGTALTVFLLIPPFAYHLGRHAWDIPLRNWTHITFYQFVTGILFLFNTCFTKVSVLLFYRRLADGATTPKWKAALITCIVFTVIWTCGIVFGALIPICNPISAYWLQFDLSWRPSHVGTYQCVHTTVILPIYSSLLIFSDLYVTILPCILVRKLQMAKRTKIALYALFSLGLVVTLFSIVRTIFAFKTRDGDDISWNMYYQSLFVQLEAQLGMICACTPSMRALVKQHLPSIKSMSLLRSGRSERPGQSKYESSERSLISSTQVSEISKPEMHAMTSVRTFYVEA